MPMIRLDDTRPEGARTVSERLDIGQLDDLLRDMRLLSTGKGRLLFAPDAYDLLRYCFPLPPFDAGHGGAPVEELADYFASVAFVLNHHAWKAILLPEYLAELHGFVASLGTKFTSSALTDARLMRTLEQVVASRLPFLPEASDPDTLLTFIKQNFNLLVMFAAAGTSEIGFRKLSELVQRDMIGLGDVVGEKEEAGYVQGIMRAFAKQYSPNEGFVRACEEAFARHFASRRGIPIESRRFRSNRSDAIALDRVLQANAMLEAAFDGSRIRYRYQIRLLSSSRRFQTLLTELDSAPEFADECYRRGARRVVRVPDQVFAFIIAQPQPSETLNMQLRADQARVTQEVLETIGWLIEINEKSVTLGHSAPDPAIVARRRLLDKHRKEVLEPFQDSYENLALFAKMRHLPNFGSRTSEETYRGDHPALLRYLNELVGNRSLDEAADRALKAQRELVRAHTILAHRWCTVLSTEGVAPHLPSPDIDRVRGTQQALPWLVRLRSPELLSSLSVARLAVTTHLEDVTARRVMLGHAFEILIGCESNRDFSHESGEIDLARAILFLALDDHDGVAAAVSIARDVANGPSSLRIEALYVLAWAARRKGDFGLAERTAARGVEESDADPRFWHGLALAKYAAAAGRALESMELDEIRLCLELALEGYKMYEIAPPEMRTPILAGCINALAYILALDGARDQSLSRARERVTELKGLCRRKLWRQYPEFFHTEAFIEQQEASRIRDKDVRRVKLSNAQKAALQAVRFAPNRTDYRSLLQEIELGLRQL